MRTKQEIEDQLGETVAIPTDKPPVKLTGRDGNAFMILGHCMKAAKRAGWTKEQIAAWKQKATSGDYDCLVGAAEEHFEVS